MPEPASIQDQLATAVVEYARHARHARHHPDCYCGEWRGVYCTSMEERWSSMLDRLIDQARHGADAPLTTVSRT